MAEILSLHDAVEQFIQDGDSVALGTAAAHGQAPGEA